MGPFEFEQGNFLIKKKEQENLKTTTRTKKRRIKSIEKVIYTWLII